MKTLQKLIILVIFACVLSACSNVPISPTKTPTMSPEEMMQAAQETAEALRRETETQWAIENPTATPTNTPTPGPTNTPTSLVPLIPPTATEEPRPYLRVGYTTHTIYAVGDPGNWNNFVPLDNLYIEVCFTNEGSGTWNENYFCKCTNNGGAIINPDSEVYLGKTVSTGQKACFSFQRVGSPNTALTTYCPVFQIFTDTGNALTNGFESACFTIH
jgi:hypothetical protein